MLNIDISKPPVIEGLPETYFAAMDLYINDLTLAHKRKSEKYQIAVYRENSLADLFFLLVFTLKAKYLNNEFMFFMCREVQKRPNGYLDLWSRAHGKTSIIGLGLTILDILRNPKVTFGLFSHDAKSSRALLRQIKTEFETSVPLRSAFPDILYTNPQAESPLWSLQEGIIVRRNGNPREATVEANSILSLPTGKHYSHLFFDDLVTEESVNTHDQKEKTISQYGLATALTTRQPVMRVTGTFYAPDDAYTWMLDRGTYLSRMVPATDNGKATGKPVFWTDDEFRAQYNSKSEYIANCQLLLNPKMENVSGFKEEWWLTWPNSNHENLNFYIIVDPARSKSKAADNTAMWLIGYGADKNIYVVDFVYDKLSLTEKADVLFKWHQNYPVLKVFYERVGMQEDIAHMEYRMEQENYRFQIEELSPGQRRKEGRINALRAWFEKGRIFFPPQTVHYNYKGEKVNMILAFKNNEYLAWPIVGRDDGLDGLAYVEDIDFAGPMAQKKKKRRANVTHIKYGSFAGYTVLFAMALDYISSLV